MQNVVLGLDISLTATGLALLILDDNWEVTSKVTKQFGTTSKDKGYGRKYRYGHIVAGVCDTLYEALKNYNMEELKLHIGLEMYIMGGKGRSLFTLAELQGYVKAQIYSFVIPYLNPIVMGRHIVEIPPTVLKQFATGKGNAKKEMMQQSLFQRLNVCLASDNECDAYWVAEYVRIMENPNTLEARKQALMGVVTIF